MPLPQPKIAVLALAATLVLGVAQSSGSAQTSQTPYAIDVIAELTGQAAFIGKSNQDSLVALEGAVNRAGGINGRPIRFAFSDDQTSPQIAVQLANEIIRKGAPVFLGPNLTATCRATAPLVANGPVEYCLSPGLHPPKDSYAFSINVATGDAIACDLRYVRERGWRRIAYLTTTDATGQDADQSFEHWLAQPENKDLVVAAHEHFAVGDVSVAAQMTRIIATHPQAVIVWASGTPLGTAFRGYHDAGGDAPVFANNTLSSVQLKQYAGFLPKDLFVMTTGEVVHAAQSPASRRAQDLYLRTIAAAGIPNDFGSGIVWDAAMIVVDALRKLGTNTSAAQVRDYIEHLSRYPGISGTYDFTDGSQRGLGQKDLLAVRWDPAKNAWTAAGKFGGTP